MSGSGQLLLSFDKGILSQKLINRNASTPTKNGSSVNRTSRRKPMSEKTWKRNTTGIAAHAQARREHKRKGVEDAIATLLREQKPINFHIVAKAAGVSKAYLYSQPDLRERIEVLRQQSVEQMIRERATCLPSKTDASRDLVILPKHRPIKELQPENHKLHPQLQLT